jgi:hypothetical protein
MPLVPILAVVFSFVVVAAAVIGAVVTAQRSDARLHRGVTASTRRAVRANGLRAQAKIIDVQFETLLGANDMVVEVNVHGRPPYRAEVAEVLGLDLTDFAFSGMTIAVFVDRNDPRVVVVDIADLERKARQKIIDDKERHAAILRGR